MSERKTNKESDQMRFSLLLCSIVLLASCATTPPISSESENTSPREAVMLAADAAPDGVPGVYEMVVVATGESRGAVFLNSEEDYRDQRNLTVAISPRMRRYYTEKFGLDPKSYFKGKRIAVRGLARRVRIDFVDAEEQPTGKYYYQTHVRVQNPSDISEL